MSTAIWMIAICEVLRILQNTIQLLMVRQQEKLKKDMYGEFAKSLSQTDTEFIKALAKTIDEQKDGEA